MNDLQAEIELTVELRRFFNIDLFVQGYYQIRAGIKLAPKFQSTVEVKLKSEFAPSYDDYSEQTYPACIYNDYGVSKTFLIVYKNAEVELDDQFTFKLAVIVDAQNITDCFNRMDMQLYIDLYFMEKDYIPEKIGTMQSLCSRCYKLNFNPRVGLHTHVPILFDYFHLSALTTTIHGSLLCLIPPRGFDRSHVHPTSLFSFLYGQDIAQISNAQLGSGLLDRAFHLHNNLCEILLSGYESLQDFYEKMIEFLPPNETKPTHHHQNCRQKLKDLSQKLKETEDINSFDSIAHAHIAQCSAENILLWYQFIQKFGLHETTVAVLARDYHLKRVKRLSEGFFLRETSRIHLLVNEGDIYNNFHELVRNSPYYARLPLLPVECSDVDGTPDTLPILIEEIYVHSEQQSLTSLPSLSPKNNEKSFAPPANDDHSKRRPKFSYSASANLNEVTSNSAPLSPSTRRPTSKREQLKHLSTSSSLNDASLTSSVQQTSKSPSLFRGHTSRHINPLLPLTSDSSIKLTSIRKLDQDKMSSASLPLKSNTGPSFGLFPNQSDSELNSSQQKRLEPSRLTAPVGHHSLPNVSFELNDSATTTKSNSISSPSVSKHLGSTFDNVTDDVFVTVDQDKVIAASSFDDSSMKSKVLRASYRGKSHTMDRRATKPSTSRSLSTSSTCDHHDDHLVNAKPRSFTADDDSARTTNPSVNDTHHSSLRSMQQAEKMTADNQQNRPLSMHEIDPLLLNGLTDEENQANLIEKTGQLSSSLSNENDDKSDQSMKVQSSKGTNPLEYDRLQNNSINSRTIEFVVQKERLKQTLASKYPLNLMFLSDLSNPTSINPYFYSHFTPPENHGVHLIICVHGLDGNSADLRLIKTYLELCLPSYQLEFLMSSSNHSSTFDDIDVMVQQLLREIDSFTDHLGIRPKRISFIGHSLGNLIIRATVSHPDFAQYRPLLYTYLSLSGPHLGTLFNTSGLVNIGMWLMQKWKKSSSLSQMSFSDHIDPKQTYLYKLSKRPCLEFFKNIVLVASPQDRYVPFHSARIEICKAALKDTLYGSIYVEMINNLLEPILRNPSITFVRYNAFHNIPSGTNNIIGRAAHIAILDSELFVEKLVLISAAKYFK